MGLDLNALQLTAERAAYLAGNLVREMWQTPLQIRSKGYRDIVTDADYASQHAITNFVQERFPDHGFLVEEDNPDLPRDGEIIWIIDPIDGTSNFSRSQPIFCVSIAASVSISKNRSVGYSNPGESDTNTLAGVIYDPLRGEMFSSAAGAGSTLNGQPIQVSQVNELESAVVCLDVSRQENERQEMLNAVGRIAHRVRTIRAHGSAALAMAWVAAGRLDIYINTDIGPWDVAAASLLISEAGGQVSNHDNQSWTVGDSGCIASNGNLHDSFYKLLYP
jgi:myo-inositol-1(or 4)-monophosphatase